MSNPPHIFSLKDAAVGYALCAGRISGDDPLFLNSNPACIPIFVSMLFQSLEISIKHAGIESGLFTMSDARSRQYRSGHGIQELAKLACERLGGDPYKPVVMALTYKCMSPNSTVIISKMVSGPELENSRKSYASRCLGYAEISDGDFQLINPVPDWVAAVRETAENLPQTVEVLRHWKNSSSTSRHFAIWEV